MLYTQDYRSLYIVHCEVCVEKITLSPNAVAQINESLSNGKEVQIAVRNHRLIIWEMNSKKRYEVVVTQPHGSAN